MWRGLDVYQDSQQTKSHQQISVLSGMQSSSRDTQKPTEQAVSRNTLQ